MLYNKTVFIGMDCLGGGCMTSRDLKPYTTFGTLDGRYADHLRMYDWQVTDQSHNCWSKSRNHVGVGSLDIVT